MKRVLIMAGGTGGHVFPALAVANVLQQQGIEVHWLGTQAGLESDLVPKANLAISYIDITGWRGKGLKKWLLSPVLLLRALFQARQVIKQFNPDVVLGMGGFVSGPGGLAAKILRKPLVIHEQNSVPGLTNRVLAMLATQVLEAFPGAFPQRYQAQAIGNPVRPEIANLPEPAQRWQNRSGPIRLLVLGGSQGALAINHVLPSTLTILSSEQRPIVLHQTGKRHLDETRRMYQILGLKVELVPFIENMAQAYEWADLVICRAGALTVAELAAAGVGSILVPFPQATDDHQTKNAQYLVKAKAAIALPQKELTTARLADLLGKLMKSREALLEMAKAARQLHHPEAAEKLAQYCVGTIKVNSVPEID